MGQFDAFDYKNGWNSFSDPTRFGLQYPVDIGVKGDIEKSFSFGKLSYSSQYSVSYSYFSGKFQESEGFSIGANRAVGPYVSASDDGSASAGIDATLSGKSFKYGASAELNADLRFEAKIYTGFVPADSLNFDDRLDRQGIPKFSNYISIDPLWFHKAVWLPIMVGFNQMGEAQIIQSLYQAPRCFPAQTPIAISPTQTKPIADIRAGDVVMSSPPTTALGRGALVPRRVVRLYRNTTREWVKVTWVEGGEEEVLIFKLKAQACGMIGSIQAKFNAGSALGLAALS